MGGRPLQLFGLAFGLHSRRECNIAKRLDCRCVCDMAINEKQPDTQALRRVRVNQVQKFTPLLEVRERLRAWRTVE